MLYRARPNHSQEWKILHISIDRKGIYKIPFYAGTFHAAGYTFLSFYINLT